VQVSLSGPDITEERQGWNANWFRYDARFRQMVCQVTLCEAEGKSEKSIFKLTKSYTLKKGYSPPLLTTLVGSQTVSGILIPELMENRKAGLRAIDQESQMAMFFVFPDLSVRIQGEFCFAILLVDLSRYDR
jgi:hypothetical protein